MSTFYEPGIYRCNVTRQALSQSKNGNPQFILTFMIKEQVSVKDPGITREVPTQYERSIWMTITEKTADFVTDDLARLGFVGVSFGGLDPETPDFHDFTGLVLDVECYHDTWDGQVREKWRLVREGGMEFDPLEKSAVRKLDAMFGKALKSKCTATAETVEKAPEAAAIETVETSADDLPF